MSVPIKMMEEQLEKAIQRDDIAEVARLLRTNSELFGHAVETWALDPLLLACKHKSFKVANKIIELKPELAKKKHESCNRTALHISSVLGDVKMVKLLVGGKEAINHSLHLVEDDNSMIPLHLATVHGHVDVVRVLGDYSPLMSLAKKTTEEETALHLALKNRHLDVFKVLVEKVEEHGHYTYQKHVLGSQDSDGNTPMHIAIANKQVEAVRLLVTTIQRSSSTCTGARKWWGLRLLDTKNNKGETPVDIHYHQCNTAATGEIGDLIDSLRTLAAVASSPRTPKRWACPTTWPFEQRNLLLTVLVMMVGVTFTCTIHLSSPTLGERYAVGAVYHVRDVLSGRLPTLFYKLLLMAYLFTFSLGGILFFAWSLPIWSLVLYLAITFFIVYFLFMFIAAPKFPVRGRSRNIPSRWLLWVLVFIGLAVMTVAYVFLLLLAKLLRCQRAVDWLQKKKRGDAISNC